MNAIEIVELIKQANPKLLGKLPDARAAKIITAALREISKQVGVAEEGSMKVVGLGSFKVREVVREKEGEVIGVKKIAFRAAKLKVKAETQD